MGNLIVANASKGHKLLNTNIIKLAQQHYQQGRVIAYPTEAVYGLGCDPLNQQAVEQVLALKQRPVEKGLILVAAHPQALQAFAQIEQADWSERVLKSWQDTRQAITWLLPKTRHCPAWISGQHASVAVRVSHHPTVKSLCQDQVWVSTSANPAGEAPALNCQTVRDYFGDELLCIDAPLGGLAQPSQIWDGLSLTRLR